MPFVGGCLTADSDIQYDIRVKVELKCLPSWPAFPFALLAFRFSRRFTLYRAFLALCASVVTLAGFWTLEAQEFTSASISSRVIS